MRVQTGFLALIAAGAITGNNTQATIIGGSITGGSVAGGGTFVKLTPPLGNAYGAPNSVGDDTFQTPNLYGFDEDQNVIIGPSDLSVDLLAGGGSGLISAGTEVASHYVFFDPETVQTQIGYVDFDADILAVITSRGTLAASDYLANSGVTYVNPSNRGLEPVDHVTIDPTYAYRLLVNWKASGPGDYVRVLTKHSPGANVPDAGATWGMLTCGLAALAGLRRSRLQ